MTSLATLAVMLLLPSFVSAQFSMEATVQITQFDRLITDAFEGDPPATPLVVSTAASESDLNHSRCTEAAAAPFALQTFAVGTGASISIPRAWARFSNAEINFQDSSNLRSLMTPETPFIDLLLNLRYVVATTKTGDGSANVTTNIRADSLIRSFSSASHSTRLDSTGFFEDLPEAGGEVEFAVPLRISPLRLNGLTAKILASISSNAFVWRIAGPGNNATSAAAIQLGIVEGQREITLASGESLSSLGVSYSFTPEPLVDFDGDDPIVIRHCSPGGGVSQVNAILPNLISAGLFQFFNAPTENWFDPPTADAFEYQITSSLGSFADILDFPTGFEDEFRVSVGGIELPGTFGPGDHVHFADYLDLLGDLVLDDLGVQQFLVSGIRPGADPNSDTAFPLKLGFSTPTVDFSMRAVAVPEPGSCVLVLMASSIWAVARLRKRR